MVGGLVNHAGRPGHIDALLPHVAQVGGVLTVENFINAKLRRGVAEVFEETPAAAEEHGCQGDFHFVHGTEVEILLDHIRTTGDANITTAGGFTSERKCTLWSVVDEVKGRAAGPHPGF